MTSVVRRDVLSRSTLQSNQRKVTVAGKTRVGSEKIVLTKDEKENKTIKRLTTSQGNKDVHNAQSKVAAAAAGRRATTVSSGDKNISVKQRSGRAAGKEPEETVEALDDVDGGLVADMSAGGVNKIMEESGTEKMDTSIDVEIPSEKLRERERSGLKIETMKAKSMTKRQTASKSDEKELKTQCDKASVGSSISNRTIMKSGKTEKARSVSVTSERISPSVRKKDNSPESVPPQPCKSDLSTEGNTHPDKESPSSIPIKSTTKDTKTKSTKSNMSSTSTIPKRTASSRVKRQITDTITSKESNNENTANRGGTMPDRSATFVKASSENPSVTKSRSSTPVSTSSKSSKASDEERTKQRRVTKTVIKSNKTEVSRAKSDRQMSITSRTEKTEKSVEKVKNNESGSRKVIKQTNTERVSTGSRNRSRPNTPGAASISSGSNQSTGSVDLKSTPDCASGTKTDRQTIQVKTTKKDSVSEASNKTTETSIQTSEDKKTRRSEIKARTSASEQKSQINSKTESSSGRSKLQRHSVSSTPKQDKAKQISTTSMGRQPSLQKQTSMTRSRSSTPTSMTSSTHIDVKIVSSSKTQDGTKRTSTKSVTTQSSIQKTSLTRSRSSTPASLTSSTHSEVNAVSKSKKQTDTRRLSPTNATKQSSFQKQNSITESKSTISTSLTSSTHSEVNAVSKSKKQTDTRRISPTNATKQSSFQKQNSITGSKSPASTSLTSSTHSNENTKTKTHDPIKLKSNVRKQPILSNQTSLTRSRPSTPASMTSSTHSDTGSSVRSKQSRQRQTLKTTSVKDSKEIVRKTKTSEISSDRLEIKNSIPAATRKTTRAKPSDLTGCSSLPSPKSDITPHQKLSADESDKQTQSKGTNNYSFSDKSTVSKLHSNQTSLSADKTNKTLSASESTQKDSGIRLPISRTNVSKSLPSQDHKSRGMSSAAKSVTDRLSSSAKTNLKTGENNDDVTTKKKAVQSKPIQSIQKNLKNVKALQAKKSTQRQIVNAQNDKNADETESAAKIEMNNGANNMSFSRSDHSCDDDVLNDINVPMATDIATRALSGPSALIECVSHRDDRKTDVICQQKSVSREVTDGQNVHLADQLNTEGLKEEDESHTSHLSVHANDYVIPTCSAEVHSGEMPLDVSREKVPTAHTPLQRSKTYVKEANGNKTHLQSNVESQNTQSNRSTKRRVMPRSSYDSTDKSYHSSIPTQSNNTEPECLQEFLCQEKNTESHSASYNAKFKTHYQLNSAMQHREDKGENCSEVLIDGLRKSEYKTVHRLPKEAGRGVVDDDLTFDSKQISTLPITGAEVTLGLTERQNKTNLSQFNAVLCADGLSTDDKAAGDVNILVQPESLENERGVQQGLRHLPSEVSKSCDCELKSDKIESPCDRHDSKYGTVFGEALQGSASVSVEGGIAKTSRKITSEHVLIKRENRLSTVETDTQSDKIERKSDRDFSGLQTVCESASVPTERVQDSVGTYVSKNNNRLKENELKCDIEKVGDISCFKRNKDIQDSSVCHVDIDFSDMMMDRDGGGDIVIGQASGEGIGKCTCGAGEEQCQFCSNTHDFRPVEYDETVCDTTGSGDINVRTSKPRSVVTSDKTIIYMGTESINVHVPAGDNLQRDEPKCAGQEGWKMHQTHDGYDLPARSEVEDEQFPRYIDSQGRPLCYAYVNINKSEACSQLDYPIRQQYDIDNENRSDLSSQNGNDSRNDQGNVCDKNSSPIFLTQPCDLTNLEESNLICDIPETAPSIGGISCIVEQSRMLSSPVNIQHIYPTSRDQSMTEYKDRDRLQAADTCRLKSDAKNKDIITQVSPSLIKSQDNEESFTIRNSTPDSDRFTNKFSSEKEEYFISETSTHEHVRKCDNLKSEVTGQQTWSEEHAVREEHVLIGGTDTDQGPCTHRDSNLAVNQNMFEDKTSRLSTVKITSTLKCSSENSSLRTCEEESVASETVCKKSGDYESCLIPVDGSSGITSSHISPVSTYSSFRGILNIQQHQQQQICGDEISGKEDICLTECESGSGQFQLIESGGNIDSKQTSGGNIDSKHTSETSKQEKTYVSLRNGVSQSTDINKHCSAVQESTTVSSNDQSLIALNISALNNKQLQRNSDCVFILDPAIQSRDGRSENLDEQDNNRLIDEQKVPVEPQLEFNSSRSNNNNANWAANWTGEGSHECDGTVLTGYYTEESGDKTVCEPVTLQLSNEEGVDGFIRVYETDKKFVKKGTCANKHQKIFPGDEICRAPAGGGIKIDNSHCLFGFNDVHNERTVPLNAGEALCEHVSESCDLFEDVYENFVDAEETFDTESNNSQEVQHSLSKPDVSGGSGGLYTFSDVNSSIESFQDAIEDVDIDSRDTCQLYVHSAVTPNDEETLSQISLPSSDLSDDDVTSLENLDLEFCDICLADVTTVGKEDMEGQRTPVSSKDASVTRCSTHRHVQVRDYRTAAIEKDKSYHGQRNFPANSLFKDRHNVHLNALKSDVKDEAGQRVIRKFIYKAGNDESISAHSQPEDSTSQHSEIERSSKTSVQTDTIGNQAHPDSKHLSVIASKPGTSDSRMYVSEYNRQHKNEQLHTTHTVSRIGNDLKRLNQNVSKRIAKIENEKNSGPAQDSSTDSSVNTKIETAMTIRTERRRRRQEIQNLKTHESSRTKNTGKSCTQSDMQKICSESETQNNNRIYESSKTEAVNSSVISTVSQHLTQVNTETSEVEIKAGEIVHNSNLPQNVDVTCGQQRQPDCDVTVAVCSEKLFLTSFEENICEIIQKQTCEKEGTEVNNNDNVEDDSYKHMTVERNENGVLLEINLSKNLNDFDGQSGIIKVQKAKSLDMDDIQYIDDDDGGSVDKTLVCVGDTPVKEEDDKERTPTPEATFTVTYEVSSDDETKETSELSTTMLKNDDSSNKHEVNKSMTMPAYKQEIEIPNEGIRQDIIDSSAPDSSSSDSTIIASPETTPPLKNSDNHVCPEVMMEVTPEYKQEIEIPSEGIQQDINDSSASHSSSSDITIIASPETIPPMNNSDNHVCPEVMVEVTPDTDAFAKLQQQSIDDIEQLPDNIEKDTENSVLISESECEETEEVSSIQEHSSDVTVNEIEMDEADEAQVCEESNISVAKALQMERQKMSLSFNEEYTRTDRKVTLQPKRSITADNCTIAHFEKTEEATKLSSQLKIPDSSQKTNIKKSKSFRLDRENVYPDKDKHSAEAAAIMNKRVANICRSFLNKARPGVKPSTEPNTSTGSPAPQRKLMKWVNANGKWQRIPIDEETPPMEYDDRTSFATTDSAPTTDDELCKSQEDYEKYDIPISKLIDRNIDTTNRPEYEAESDREDGYGNTDTDGEDVSNLPDELRVIPECTHNIVESEAESIYRPATPTTPTAVIDEADEGDDTIVNIEETELALEGNSEDRIIEATPTASTDRHLTYQALATDVTTDEEEHTSNIDSTQITDKDTSVDIVDSCEQNVVAADDDMQGIHPETVNAKMAEDGSKRDEEGETQKVEETEICCGRGGFEPDIKAVPELKMQDFLLGFGDQPSRKRDLVRFGKRIDVNDDERISTPEKQDIADIPKQIPKLKAVKIQEEVYECKPEYMKYSNIELLEHDDDKSLKKSGVSDTPVIEDTVTSVRTDAEDESDNEQETWTLTKVSLRKSKTFSGIDNDKSSFQTDPAAFRNSLSTSTKSLDIYSLGPDVSPTKRLAKDDTSIGEKPVKMRSRSRSVDAVQREPQSLGRETSGKSRSFRMSSMMGAIPGFRRKSKDSKDNNKKVLEGGKVSHTSGGSVEDVRTDSKTDKRKLKLPLFMRGGDRSKTLPRTKLLSEIVEVEENKDDVSQPTGQHPQQQHDKSHDRHGRQSTRPVPKSNKRRSLSLPTGSLAFGEARIVYKNGHFTIETLDGTEIDSTRPTDGNHGDQECHNELNDNNSTDRTSAEEIDQSTMGKGDVGEGIHLQRSHRMKRQYAKTTLNKSDSSEYEDVFTNYECDIENISPNSQGVLVSSQHSDSQCNEVCSNSSHVSEMSLGSSCSEGMDLDDQEDDTSLRDDATGEVKRVAHRPRRTPSFKQAQEAGLRLTQVDEDSSQQDVPRRRTGSLDESQSADLNKSSAGNKSTLFQKMMPKRKTPNENLTTFSKQSDSAKDFFAKKMTLKGLFKKNKSESSVGSPIKTMHPVSPPIAAFQGDDDIGSVDTPPSSPFPHAELRRRHTSADIINYKNNSETTNDSNSTTPTQERNVVSHRHSVSSPSTPSHEPNSFVSSVSSGSMSSSKEIDQVSVSSISSATSSVQGMQSPLPDQQPHKPKTPKPVGASPRRNPSTGSMSSHLRSQSAQRTKSVTSLESDHSGDGSAIDAELAMCRCECGQRLSQNKVSEDYSEGVQDYLPLCQYCRRLAEYYRTSSGLLNSNVDRIRKHSLVSRQNSDDGTAVRDRLSDGDSKSRKDSTTRGSYEKLCIVSQTDVVSSNSNDSGIQRDDSAHSSTDSLKVTPEGPVRLRRRRTSASPPPERPRSEVAVRWADLDLEDVDAMVSPVRMRSRDQASRNRPRPKSDFDDNIHLFDELFEEVLEDFVSEGSSFLSDRMRAFGSEVNLQPYCSLRNLYEMRRRDLDKQKNRRMSTPHPIKSRLQRSPRKLQKSTSLVRSNSMPESLDKIRKRRKLNHLLDFHLDTFNRNVMDLDEYSDDSDLSFDHFSLTEKNGSIRSSEGQLTSMDEIEDNLTYAEALWDHITMDPEELAFRAQDVIEVLDMSDKDWWFGIIDDREGWFPATFVRLRVNQDQMEDDFDNDLEMALHEDVNTSPKQRRISMFNKNQARTNVVNEIINAEREYVKHLQDVVEGYIVHARKRKEMFPQERIELIFGNLETIYKFAQKFLLQLERCIDEIPHLSEIGQCFLDNVRGFEIYSDYCNNHPSAIEELKELCRDSKYKHFFEACRLLQELAEIPLEGFLLTPVQKICKYQLQLGELLKYTPPDHADFQFVKDALVAMRKIATLINERKRKMESIEKIATWQHSVVDWEDEDLLMRSSELIFSGEVNKINSAGWSQERYFFLFDHQLIYCKKEFLKRHLFSYKGRIDVDNCEVIDVPDGKDSQYNVTVKNAWKIHEVHKDKWYLLHTKMPAMKERWLKALKDERKRVQEDRDNDFCVPDHWKQSVLNKVRSQSSLKDKQSSRGPHSSGFSYQSKDFAYSTLPRRVRNQKQDKKKGWFIFGGGKKSKR